MQIISRKSVKKSKQKTKTNLELSTDREILSQKTAQDDSQAWKVSSQAETQVFAGFLFSFPDSRTQTCRVLESIYKMLRRHAWIRTYVWAHPIPGINF